MIWTVMYSIMTTWMRDLLEEERAFRFHGYYYYHTDTTYEYDSVKYHIKGPFEFNLNFHFGLIMAMTICSTTKVSFSCQVLTVNL